MASHAKQKLVVVGNGMAPGRALERLFETAPDAYDVTIFNAEPRVNYDRIMLSPVLSGDKSFEEIVIHGDGWYVKHGVTLYKGAKVTKIDRAARTVTAEFVPSRSGQPSLQPAVTVAYDKLMVATGSNPSSSRCPAMTCRACSPIAISTTSSDAAGRQVARQCRGHRRRPAGPRSRRRPAGAGHGRHRRAPDADPDGAPARSRRRHLLEQAIEERGIKVLTRANTKAVLGTDRVEAVELDDGTTSGRPGRDGGRHPPRHAARQGGGLDGQPRHRGRRPPCAPAIPISSPWANAPNIDGSCYGLVAPLYEMATRCRQLVGEAAALQVEPTATKLKVTGINLFSAGDFAEGEDREEIVLRDATRGVYKRLVLKDDRIIGAVLYGETSDGPWFFDLLKRGTDVADMRDTLIFGQAYAGRRPARPGGRRAALPDEAEICGCNGVCKGKITGRHHRPGLNSLDEVRAHTKASASCGSCTDLVEQLLKARSATPTIPPPSSRCAPAPIWPRRRPPADRRQGAEVDSRRHAGAGVEDLVRLRQVPAGAELLPGLRLAGRISGRRQSRFINERVHANIQKDGTYSVVPRMWGG